MIVPALLSSKKIKMQEMLDSCSRFAKLVQVDIMDGKFVPSKSISLDELSQLKIKIDSELHLMVENPFAWIAPACKIKTKRIIFHLETKVNHRELIAEIKKNKMEAGACLNPGTKIEKLQPLINRLDLILFMSVNPGFYGAPFIPEVLGKIKAFQRKYPGKKTAIDGGIKKENFAAVKKSQIDYICVGSAILKNKNPRQAFAEFKRLDSQKS